MDPHDELVEQSAALAQVIELLCRGDDRDFGLAMVLRPIAARITIATEQIGTMPDCAQQAA